MLDTTIVSLRQRSTFIMWRGQFCDKVWFLQQTTFWVSEGGLAGFVVRHGIASELVWGAGLSCKLMCGAGNGDLGRVPGGRPRPQNPRKPVRRFLARLPSATQKLQDPPSRLPDRPRDSYPRRPPPPLASPHRAPRELDAHGLPTRRSQ